MLTKKVIGILIGTMSVLSLSTAAYAATFTCSCTGSCGEPGKVGRSVSGSASVETLDVSLFPPSLAGVKMVSEITTVVAANAAGGKDAVLGTYATDACNQAMQKMIYHKDCVFTVGSTRTSSLPSVSVSFMGNPSKPSFNYTNLDTKFGLWKDRQIYSPSCSLTIK